MIASTFSQEKDPIYYTLREAFEHCHRSAGHSDRYVAAARIHLDHWERCTDNPPIGEIDNRVMHQFKTRFLSSPLPSKMSRLFRRAKRGDRRATRVLSALGLPWRELCHLDQQRRYSAVTDRFLSGNVPAEAVFLLPRAATFNSTRRTIEAILSTVGPARHGKPFALGYLDDVPCCRPEDEDEPDVIVASLDEVSAIYRACSNVDWPDRRKTGVPAPDLWRALLVWLYNVATRRTDFLMLRKAQIRLDSRGQDGLVLLRQNKTGKSRWLPLNETVVRHLRLIWHSKGPRVFPFPDNRHALYGRWREIQKAAGIHVDRPDWSDRHDVYSFHELRKTSLGEYFVINEGVAQQMGCHAQLATTLKHYVPAVRKDGKLREAVTQLPQPIAFLCDDEPSPPSTDGRPRLRIVS